MKASHNSKRNYFLIVGAFCIITFGYLSIQKADKVYFENINWRALFFRHLPYFDVGEETTPDDENEKRKQIWATDSVFELQELLSTQINCSGEIRIGNYGDGGKWVCNPEKASGQCVAYSLGVQNDVGFESHLFELTENTCDIYSFEASSNTDEKKFIPFNGTFRQWKIWNETNETVSQWSVFDIMKHFSHEKIDFFKIDIEGGEYVVLPSILQSELGKNGKICQIFVEIHDYSNVTYWKLLTRDFEQAGFLMFHKEPNLVCLGLKRPCCEYSYIHESCLNKYDVPNVVFHKNYD